MNDTRLLERLTSAYATVDAPKPSAALAEILESGRRGHDGETRDAVVVPFERPRSRRGPRMRFLVAAVVATLVLTSGLAVAGALPDSLQRAASSMVAHLGIDLPHPDTSRTGWSNVGTAPGGSQHPRPASASTRTPATDPGSTSPGPPPTTPAGLLPGDVGGATSGGASAPTPKPPTGDGLLPPPSIPEVTLPPVTVPQLMLPPVTVPPVTLAPSGL